MYEQYKKPSAIAPRTKLTGDFFRGATTGVTAMCVTNYLRAIGDDWAKEFGESAFLDRVAANEIPLHEDYYPRRNKLEIVVAHGLDALSTAGYLTKRTDAHGSYFVATELFVKEMQPFADQAA